MNRSRWKHQEKEYLEHRYDRSRALLWQPRTGKSRLIIDTACALHQALEIGGVLVIAPNGVHENWTELEIPKHCWEPCYGFAWRFSDSHNAGKFGHFVENARIRPECLSWFCVNMEAISRDEVKKAIKRFIKAAGPIMVVYDESHHFAAPRSKRTSTARGIARLAAYRRILSGTSVENSPRQAFSQFELLEKSALGHRSLGSFDREFVEFEMRQAKGSRQYKVVSRYVNMDELKERMAKYSSVVLRSDCEDLPAVQEDVRYVELDEAQRVAWRAIKKREILALEAMGLDKPLNGGAAFTKLQQVEGGFLKTEQGIQIIGEVNPAISACMDEIEQATEPVIIWCQFIHEIEATCRALQDRSVSFRAYHGRISPSERRAIRGEFRDGAFDVLVAQPMAAGEGHDFSAAGLIVWYSQTPDAIVRQQASERGTAVGKGSTQIIHLIVRGGVNDHYKHDITDNKITLADDISRRGLKLVLENMDVH